MCLVLTQWLMIHQNIRIYAATRWRCGSEKKKKKHLICDFISTSTGTEVRFRGCGASVLKVCFGLCAAKPIHLQISNQCILKMSMLQALVCLLPERSASVLFYLTLLEVTEPPGCSTPWLDNLTNTCTQVLAHGCVTQDANMYSMKMMCFSAKEV